MLKRESKDQVLSIMWATEAHVDRDADYCRLLTNPPLSQKIRKPNPPHILVRRQLNK